ncbi:SLBB domain-containing protein [Phormidium tenue FACHB-886]|nr:SLBB domain-containing protein [Phormidium tenue FACHB-886]
MPRQRFASSIESVVQPVGLILATITTAYPALAVTPLPAAAPLPAATPVAPAASPVSTPAPPVAQMSTPVPSAVPSATPSPAPYAAPNAAPNAAPRTTPSAPPVRSNVYLQPEAPYVLGSGDRVQIDIFQVPQYSGQTDVLIDGALNLPLVGKIPVGGLTIEQATAAVSAAYGQFLRRPIVTISLLTRRPLEIGIAGEVNRPGSYTISQDGAQYPTVTQLLQTAGGLTRIADVRNVQIRRPQQSGLEQVINVDLWQLIQTGDLRYDIPLRDGDTVYIPETNVDLAESAVLASTSFSAQEERPINIAIVGEVFRPGTYSVTGETSTTEEAGTVGSNTGSSTLPTVTRAIQAAGGIKPLANIREVEVRRLTRAGTEQSFKVNLWALLTEGDLRQDALLQEGDTVVIPTATQPTPAEAAQIATASFSPDRIRINVVGEVTAPGVVEVPPNTPLNQAILAAGGFNTRARRGSVDLIRLNPDGTVTKQDIDIDFERGINDAGNPALRNNDVVIVRRSGLASVGDALGTILNPLNGLVNVITAPFRFIDIFE